MSEGEFKNRLQVSTSFAVAFEITDDEELKINEILGQIQRVNKILLDKIVDEGREDFYLALEHLRNRGVESPYLESIIEKWFGEPKQGAACVHPHERIYHGCTTACKEFEKCEAKEK